MQECGITNIPINFESPIFSFSLTRDVHCSILSFIFFDNTKIGCVVASPMKIEGEESPNIPSYQNSGWGDRVVANGDLDKCGRADLRI